MPIRDGHTIALTREAYESLTGLRDELALKGTRSLPRVLAPSKLTLSEVVLLGVRAARERMR